MDPSSRAPSSGASSADQAVRGSELSARAPRRPRSSGFLAVLGIYVGMALVVFDQVEEDAFIYFRVAAHIAEGRGYVFNAGGERIETGSSPLYQLLLACAHAMGLDLVVFAKAVGLLLGGVTLYLVWRVSARVVKNELVQLVPPTLLALSVPFYFWVQRGLETPLYVAAIVLLAHRLVEDRPDPRWAVPAVLVILSRPEGFLVLGGLAGLLFFERGRLRRHALALATVVATPIVVELARLAYFGDLVPHAFYVKIQEPRFLAWDAVALYFRSTGLWVLLAAGALGLADRRVWSRSLVVLAVLAVPFLGWALTTCAYATNHRHLLPALPLLYIVATRGLEALLARWRRLAVPAGVGLTCLVLWLAFFAPSFGMSVNPAPNPFMQELRVVLSDPQRHVANLAHLLRGRPRPAVRQAELGSFRITENAQYLVGDFIRKTYPRGVTIVYDQMGQTPWYAGLDKTFIDTFGLTYRATAYPVYNEHLATLRGSLPAAYRDLSTRLLRDDPRRTWNRREALDHLFALNPELIVLLSLQVAETLADGTIRYHDNVPGAIARDPRLADRYVRRTKWFLLFYERKDLAPTVRWSEIEHFIPGKDDIPMLTPDQG